MQPLPSSVRKKETPVIEPPCPQKEGASEEISWDPDNPEKPKDIILLGIQW